MRVFREHLSVCVCSTFFFSFEGGMWDLIVLILDLAYLLIQHNLRDNKTICPLKDLSSHCSQVKKGA